MRSCHPEILAGHRWLVGQAAARCACAWRQRERERARERENGRQAESGGQLVRGCGTRTPVAVRHAFLQSDLPELIEEGAQFVAGEDLERLGNLIEVGLRFGLFTAERVPLQRQIAVPEGRGSGQPRLTTQCGGYHACAVPRR
eukprot:COSAG02_NODE_1822_length_10761_cov_48.708685_9_plen_143_part_00